MSATTVRELVATLGLKVLEGGFAAADKLFETLTSNAGERLKSLSSWASVGAGGIAAGIGAAIRSTVNEVTDMTAHLEKVSLVTGANVQNLQGWGHAARLGGASIDDFASAAQTLAEKMQEASMGSAHATMALAKLVPGKGKKDLKDLDSLFESIAEKIQKVYKEKGALEATTLARSGLGEGGVALVPTFLKGVEAMREARAEVKAFGAEFSDSDLKGAKAYRGELSRLSLVTLELKQSVAGPLHQALAEATKNFNDWVKSLRGSGVKEARSGFEQFAKLTGLLTAGMKALYGAAVFVSKYMTEIAIALGAIIATGALLWVGSLIATLVSGGALALAAWIPLVLFFGALFLILEDIYTFLTGGESVIGEFFPKVAAKVKELYELFQAGGFMAVWKKTVYEIVNYLDDHLFGWLDRKWKAFKESISISGFLDRVSGGGALKDAIEREKKRSGDESAEIRGIQSSSMWGNSKATYEMAEREYNRRKASAARDREAEGEGGLYSKAYGAMLTAQRVARGEAGYGPAQLPSGPTATSPGALARGGAGGPAIDKFENKVEIKIDGVTDPVLAAQAAKRQFDENMDGLLGPLAR